MDVKLQLLTFFENNQRKLAWFVGGCLFVYLTHKFFYKSPQKKPELTVEQIRKIIEDLPYESRNSDNLTLKDLLDELKDLNDDEEWKKLITSAQNFYNEECREVAG